MDGFLAHIPGRAGQRTVGSLASITRRGARERKKKANGAGGARAEEKGATATPSPDWKVN